TCFGSVGWALAMLYRVYKLLSRVERVALLRLLPWVVGSAIAEIVGVAAVIPFLSLLADPGSISTVPAIGTGVATYGAPPMVLLRWSGIGLAASIAIVNIMVILTNWRLLRFAWGTNHRLSARLIRHYLLQPYTFLLFRNSAELANNVTQEIYRITQEGLV